MNNALKRMKNALVVMMIVMMTITVMMLIMIVAMMIMMILPLQSSDMQTEPPPRANFCETVNQ